MGEDAGNLVTSLYPGQVQKLDLAVYLLGVSEWDEGSGWLFVQHRPEVPVRKFVSRLICLLFTLAWRAAPGSPGFKRLGAWEEGAWAELRVPSIQRIIWESQCVQAPAEKMGGLDPS